MAIDDMRFLLPPNPANLGNELAAMGQAARGRQTGSQRQANMKLAALDARADNLSGTDWQGDKARARAAVGDLRNAVSQRGLTRSARNMMLGQGLKAFDTGEEDEETGPEISGVPVSGDIFKRYQRTKKRKILGEIEADEAQQAYASGGGGRITGGHGAGGGLSAALRPRTMRDGGQMGTGSIQQGTAVGPMRLGQISSPQRYGLDTERMA